MALSADVRTRILFALLAATHAAMYFVSAPALSNPMDQFGSGSVGIAMGGTGTATADSYSATYYNPAALGLMERVEFGLGVSVYRPWLNARFNEFDDLTKMTSPVSQRRFDRATVYLEGGVAAPIPLEKDSIGTCFSGFNCRPRRPSCTRLRRSGLPRRTFRSTRSAIPVWWLTSRWPDAGSG